MPRRRKRPGPPGAKVAPGRAYGARADAEAALAAVPVETDMPGLSASPAGGGGPNGAQPAQGPQGRGALEEALAAAQAMDSPGEGLLGGEPENPEDVTSGLPVGPGGGPGMLPQLTRTGPDPSVMLWKRNLPMLGILASQPGSSPEVRQYYRRLRAQMPPDVHEQREG